MLEMFQPGVGAVFSADIAAPEHEREVAFYARVLTTGTAPLWREDLLNNLGLPIIGLGAQSAEYSQLPLQWMPHIQVADVAVSARRAVTAGGRELMHARSDAGVSQWAVLTDPNGAAFGVIPEVSVDELPAEGRMAAADAAGVGRIAWLDLTVPDAAATRDYYQLVIGWTVLDEAPADGNAGVSGYRMLDKNGTAVAGVRYARDEHADLPAAWLLHLPVGDLVESLRRTEQVGGRVVKVLQNRRGAREYAVIEDPVGVYVALMVV